MPTAGSEALVPAAREDRSLDADTYDAENRRGLAERQEALVRESHAVLRSVQGWGAIDAARDWEDIVRKADDDLQSGAFLAERLGGVRHLDPDLMAALYVLRRQLIDDHGASTAAELMMIDAALLAHFHMLRINGWIGNLAVAAESEFFGPASLTAKLEGEYGRNATVRGLRVEELVQRLAEQLMPLLDRSNRIMLRNLKALKEFRKAPAPSVSIGRAQQVNVGAQQLNVAPEPDAT